MRRCTYFLLLTPSILFFAGFAFSQVALNTGSIYGKVLDSTVAPVPGVTIVLEGEGAIAKTAYSGEAGLYRFAGLAPGVYAIRFSLQGFAEVRQENVRVMTGHTVELEVVLQQSMTEELTILGESPLVDTRKTSTSTSFNQEYLQSVPTTRDPWSVLDQVPGVDENRINVGGTSSGQQPTFAARGGSFSQNIYSYDGIDITPPGGGAPGYFDYGSFEEIQVTTGGVDPSVNTSGVVLNFITKRGGNNWSGQGDAYFANHDLQGDNVDQKLKDQHFVSPTRIDQLYEYGGDLGGPIIKDRAWIWGAYRYQNISNISAGVEIHDSVERLNGTISGQTPVLFELTHYNLKLNISYNTKQEGSFQFVRDRKQQFGRRFFGAQSPESTLDQDGFTTIYKAAHTWSPNADWFLDAKFAYVPGNSHLVPKAGIGADAQPVLRLNNDEFWENGSFFLDVNEPETSVTFDANRFLQNKWGGDHELKFGFAYKQASFTYLSQYGGDAFLYDYVGTRGDQSLGEGISKIRYEQNANIDFQQFGMYAADTWRLNRLTLNLGVRFSSSATSNNPTSAPANAVAPDLLPALTFEANDKDIRFNNFSPRLGATYDLTGNGKTIVRANYARFYDPVDLFFSRFQSPLGGYTGVYVYYTDVNGDGIITRDELFDIYGAFRGMIPGDAERTAAKFSSTQFIDDNLRAQTTNEFLVGFEREMFRNVSVAATYTHRKYDLIIDTYIPGVTSADYICLPFFATNPVTGETFTAQNCRPSDSIPTLGQQELLNTSGRTRSYDGLEMTLNKRMSNRWMVRFSATIQDQKIHFADNSTAFGGSFQDPANIPFIDNNWWASDFTGNLGSNWSIKVVSAYQFAHDITVGAYFKTAAGFIVPLFARGTFFGNYAEGSHRRLVAPMDAERLDTVHYMDVKIEKGFGLGNYGKLFVSADLFNVFNSNTAQRVSGRVDTFQFLEPSEIVNPRVVRFGLRYSY